MSDQYEVPNIGVVQLMPEPAKRYMSIANDDGGDLGSTEVLVQRLQPVQLDKDMYNMYNKTLFPRSKYRLNTVAILNEVGRVATGLNGLFMFMRYLMNEGNRINYLEQTSLQECRDFVQDRALRTYNAMEQEITGDALSDSLLKQLAGVVSNSKSYFRSSTTYSGGVDIVTRSSVRDTSIVGMDLCTSQVLLDNKDAYSDYDAARLAQFSSVTALAIKAAAERILKLLFPKSGDITDNTFPLDFDFTQAQDLLETELGYKLPVQFVSNIVIPKGPNYHAPAFFRAVLVLKGTGAKSLEATLSSIVKEGNADDYPLDHLAKAQQRIEDRLTDEARLLNGSIGGAIAITLSKDICEFISQKAPMDVTGIRSWYRIWITQSLRGKGQRADAKVGRIRHANIPRYSLSLSVMGSLTETRKQLNMSAEESRTNEEGLFLSTDGTLQAMPTTSERAETTRVEVFEGLNNELSELCTKYSTVQDIFDGPVLNASILGISQEDYNRAKEIKKELANFEGELLSYDWDTGISFFADAYGSITYKIERGAVKPQHLSIADLMGFNLSKPGQDPVIRTATQAIILATHPDPNSAGDIDSAFGTMLSPTTFVYSEHFEKLIAAYTYYVENPTAEGELLPDAQKLIHNAFTALGITTLDETTPFYAHDTYRTIIDEQGVIRPSSFVGKTPGITTRNIVRKLLHDALHSCSGANGSALHRIIRDNNVPIDRMDEETRDHEMFFLFDTSPLYKMETSLYRTIGGNVYKQVVMALSGLSFKTLNAPRKIVDASSTSDERNTIARPSTKEMLAIIKPISTLMGTYVEQYPKLEAQAENQIKSIERDPGLDVDDINFAGGDKSFAMFPHQVDTQRYLRKSEPPAFAVLDIKPGGGKTSIGIVDAACIVDDMQKIGERIRPLVICPDGLIRNWCDDTNQFTANGWNVIPINSDTVGRWGYDAMVEMIRNAPVNTLCVVGMQFLKNNAVPVSIGSAVAQIGLHVEMMKSIGFNYIVIDESHKLKNPFSARHRMVKQLTTSSNVKYLRIATGTLISDRVTDIEGQVTLFQPNIFRAGELSNTINRDQDTVEVGGEKVALWKVSSAAEVRDRLSRYAAVVTKAKKEWAFMLPSPLEKIHHIGMEGPDPDDKDAEQDRMHAKLYDVVVQESIELLSKLAAQNKNRKDGEDDDEDDSDMDEGAESNDPTASVSFDGDSFDGIPAQLVKAHIARIESLITAPQEDPAYQEIFGQQTDYHSRKARFIAHLVDKHFNVDPWEKSKRYSEYDLVSVNGENYVSRKYDTTDVGRKPLPDEATGISPDKNEQYWRREVDGKVLIFCRYTNTVEAVYNALPQKYKDIAVKFTGQETDKWGNLEQFRSNPDVKILIANEQGMSEGHNLQMASRMIRAESPWGPGELEQSASRIFRPDPKGAAAGNIYREIVFLDWVVVDHTIEIPKLGRLIAKVFESVRFDESDNPKYDEVLKGYLPEISLSIKNTLQVRSSLTDYEEYVHSYAQLNGVQRAEFADMRANQPSSMIPIPPTPLMTGSERMATVPFIPSQKIGDPNGWKPVPLSDLIKTPLYADRAEDPDLLIGQPVITDQGLGMIVSVSKRYVEKGSKVVNTDRPISSFKVRLKVADGEEDRIVDYKNLGLAFIPTKVSAAVIRDQFEVSTLTRASDIRRAAREAERLAEIERQLIEKQEKEDARKKNTESRIRVRIKDKLLADETGKKRKKNIEEGKPINTGITRVAEPKIVKGIGKGIEELEEQVPLTLRPTYYHGYLALETDDLEYAKQLKKHKFKEFGEYVFVDVKRRNQANAVMDYIEDNFDLSDATAERLGEVFKAFAKSARALYQLDLAPSTSLPHFFAIRRVMVKNKKEARIYPLFKDDTLTLVCDLRTCPVMRKHIGKSIPGAAAKWRLSTGSLMAFVRNKSEMRELVRKLHKDGIVIANRQELLKEITGIRFKATTTKKK